MQTDKQYSLYKELIEKKLLTRKEAFNKIGAGVKKLAIASLPLAAIGTFTEEAQAQYRELEVVRILNILLQMEFVLERFYLIAVLDDELIPDRYQEPIGAIKVHHQNHTLIIKGIIRRLETQTRPSPQIRATFNTENLNPKNSFDDYLQIAQVLEDASASLYKKYIPKLRELETSEKIQRGMLRTHSTEARHAAYIRLIRSERGVQNITPWISSTTNNAVLPPFQDVYINEDNTSQADIQVPFVTGQDISLVREAWDEPIEDATINRLFQLFRVRI